MEQIWNFIYLIIGATIAILTKFIEDRIKNRGDVAFDVFDIVIQVNPEEQLETKEFKFSIIKFKVDVINTSNEYKTCRHIYLDDKREKIRIGEGIPIFEDDESKEQKRFSILHIKPNTVQRFSLFFYLDGEPHEQISRNLFVTYKTKHGKQIKRFLTHL